MTLQLKLYLGGVEKATVSKMWPVVSDDNGEVAKRVPVFSICCLPVHDITGKPHHSVHFHMMLSLIHHRILYCRRNPHKQSEPKSTINMLLSWPNAPSWSLDSACVPLSVWVGVYILIPIKVWMFLKWKCTCGRGVAYREHEKQHQHW